MSSKKNIDIYKVQKLQGGMNEITEDMKSTIIKKEESNEQIQKLKLVISENRRIVDHKFPENVEILRG